MFKRLALFLTILLLSATCANAHKPDELPHQTYAMGDLQLENGERIVDFSLSYVTHGTLNASKSNAVLMLAPFAGNHHINEQLIGKGKAFDTDKLFVICADPIGNGLTTSPSNSKTQPGKHFPRFSVLDMVHSQHRLITEHFGITKLVAVAGASMGGMQSLQWAVRYPDSVATVVAIVPTTRISPWTRNLFELLHQAITLDPAWNNGDYTTQPEAGLRLWAGLMFGMVLGTPQSVNVQGSGASLTGLQDKLWQIMDANNILAQIHACTSFDLGNTPGFDGNTRKALASIKARTLVVLTKDDLILPEVPTAEDAASIPDATVVWMPSAFPPGHYTGMSSATMDSIQADIADFLNGKK